MSFLKEVIQLYVERKDWFLELIAAHIGLSLVAILCAGSIGLLLGIWISEHEKAAGPVLGVANVFYTIPSISLLGMLMQIMWKIKLPLAMGVIIAGVRNMVVMTISVAAIASFIGAGGLGVAIYRGITIYDTAMTFCGSFLIALIALICDFLLGILEKRMKKGNSI